MNFQPTLKKRYKEEIVPALMKEFNYKSVMEVPSLQKIVLNRGVGEAVMDKKLIETAQEELTAIAGQKAVKTYSKKAISNFKLRENTPIGVKVTLRRDKMYEFLERLIKVALPRVKDFNGVKSNFDGRGNFSLGLEEQIIFPEVNLDQVQKLIGLEAVFVTTAPTDEEGYALLREFGLPFSNLKKE
ncbi:MAG: 50S ribosomal protein L5 [Bacteroidales bacterium]|nr:50S ribosomal protein L5 [Bacteroidales bacterium]